MVANSMLVVADAAEVGLGFKLIEMMNARQRPVVCH